MTEIVAFDDGEWVVAEITASRRLRKDLRASVLPGDLEYDPEKNEWRIKSTRWAAAMAVFWRHQASVQYRSTRHHLSRPETPGPEPDPG